MTTYPIGTSQEEPMRDLCDQRAHFDTFGFVVLPGALTGSEVNRLRDEGDRAIRDATGDNYRVDIGLGGMIGHYIPATGARTPASVELLQRFAPLAEQLLGRPVLPSATQHALLFDTSGWHTDTSHRVPSVKVAVYFDELDGDNGALRVLPGSHRLGGRDLAAFLHGPAFDDEATWREATRQVPAHIIASRPGDVIVFDEKLWHASVDGRYRLQWSTSYVIDPVIEAEDAQLREYLAGQFIPGMTLDYDPAHYPHFGDLFRAVCPPRWATQLDRLGAFAAAAAEQHVSRL